MQFWPPDDEHMCSKHVEAWNKLIVKKMLCIRLVSYWDNNIVHVSILIYFKLWMFSRSTWLCVTLKKCRVFPTEVNTTYLLVTLCAISECNSSVCFLRNDSLLKITMQPYHHHHNYYHYNFCRHSAIFDTYRKRKYANWIKPRHSFTGSLA